MFSLLLSFLSKFTFDNYFDQECYLDAYSSLLSLSDITLTDSLALAKVIVFRHFTTIPYNNLVFFNHPHQKLFHSFQLKRGLMCFQSAYLLSQTLRRKGMVSYNVMARTLFTHKEQDDPFDHIVTILELNGQRYLLDPGFACRSISFPLKFGQKTVDYGIETRNEKAFLYRENSRLYQLFMEEKVTNKNQLLERYNQFISDSRSIAIRDSLQKIADFSQGSFCWTKSAGQGQTLLKEGVKTQISSSDRARLKNYGLYKEEL